MRKQIEQPHVVRTVAEAKATGLKDDELVIFAETHGEILVTTNRDCAGTARRLMAAQMVYLRVIESEAGTALARAVSWLEANKLPAGRVLRVTKTTEPVVMSPIPWR